MVPCETRKLTYIIFKTALKNSYSFFFYYFKMSKKKKKKRFGRIIAHKPLRMAHALCDVVPGPLCPLTTHTAPVSLAHVAPHTCQATPTIQPVGNTWSILPLWSFRTSSRPLFSSPPLWSLLWLPCTHLIPDAPRPHPCPPNLPFHAVLFFLYYLSCFTIARNLQIAIIYFSHWS